MLRTILVSSALVAVTVAIHAGGLAALVGIVTRSSAGLPSRFWPMTWLLIRTTWLLILIHLAEIAVWALFFLWADYLPDAESAFYFSGVTYATVGYGDVVLQEPGRMLGPVEGLTGILMCGLSTGLFFAVLNKLFVAKSRGELSVGVKEYAGEND